MNRAKNSRTKRKSSRHGAPTEISDELLGRVSGGIPWSGTGLNNKEMQQVYGNKVDAAGRAAIYKVAGARMEAEQRKFGDFVKKAFYSTPIGAVVNAAVSRDPKKLIGAVGIVPGVGAGAAAAVRTVAQPAVDGKRGIGYLKNVAINGAIEAVSAVPSGVGRGLGTAANVAIKAAKGADHAYKAIGAYKELKGK